MLFIFLFHSNIHLGCKYGILTSFINMGAIFMTAFFVLSGYVIYYTYQKKDLGKLANIKLFYKKRYITILPIYYLVGTLYIIFFLGGDRIFARKCYINANRNFRITVCFYEYFFGISQWRNLVCFVYSFMLFNLSFCTRNYKTDFIKK